MQISMPEVTKLKLYRVISTLLIQEDIEGLIEAGAPADEYDDEAAQIAASVSLLSHEKLKEETIIAIISLVWMKSFELAADELKLRLPAMMRVAGKIVSGETKI